MYYFFKGFEHFFAAIRTNLKIFFWKLKYGKRIVIGKNLKFRKRMNINIAKDGFLKIGNNNFFNNDCSINCHKKIVIGDDNLFCENVKIYDHNHVFNQKNIDFKKSFSENQIIIGNHNWICTNVILLKDTNIGDNNVVGNSISEKINLDSDNLVKKEQNLKIEKIKYK